MAPISSTTGPGTVLDFRPADHDLRQVSRSLAFNDFSQCLGVATHSGAARTAEYSSPGVRGQDN